MEILENHWSYDLLKEITIRENDSLGQVEELKSLFAKDIHSPRRLECIRNVKDLIDCLERRDIISEHNVEPLRHFNGEQLQEIVNNYVSPPNSQAHESINEYREMQICDAVHTINLNGHPPMMINGHMQSDNVSAVETSFHPMALSERKRAGIYKVVSQSLGTHWRSFGRELGLREGVMDEIELQCPRDLPSRIYKVLQRLEEDDSVDPKTHLQIIRNALDQCRRKDVRRQVDGIMSH